MPSNGVALVKSVAVRHTQERYCLAFFKVGGDDWYRVGFPLPREYVVLKNIDEVIRNTHLCCAVV